MTEHGDVAPWAAPAIASRIADALADARFAPGTEVGVYWDPDDPDLDMQVVWLQQPGERTRYAVAVLRFEADEDDDDWYVEAAVGHVGDEAEGDDG